MMTNTINADCGWRGELCTYPIIDPNFICFLLRYSPFSLFQLFTPYSPDSFEQSNLKLLPKATSSHVNDGIIGTWIISPPLYPAVFFTIIC